MTLKRTTFSKVEQARTRAELTDANDSIRASKITSDKVASAILVHQPDILVHHKRPVSEGEPDSDRVTLS